MQEAPNFTNYQTRFNAVDRYTVLDLREPIVGQNRAFLESVFTRLELYFNESNFRQQIPVSIKSNLEESYFISVISYLENIASWQRDGSTPINGPNISDQINNIQSILSGLDQTLSGYYYTYFSNEEQIAQKVQTIQALSKSAEEEVLTLHNVIENNTLQANDRKEKYDVNLTALEQEATTTLGEQKTKSDLVLESINSILTQAQLLVGRGSAEQLGDYYHKLANGRTTHQQSKYALDKEKSFKKSVGSIKFSYLAAGLAILSLFSYIITMYLIHHPVQLNAWGAMSIIIFGSATTIGLSTYLAVRFVYWFNGRYPGGHERTAVLWMIGAVISTLFTAVYSGILIRDLTTNGPITWEEIIPKVIVLLAPAYLVRLCVQNYRANAHLTVQYMHRATITNVAEAYSKSTEPDVNKSANPELVKASHDARMAILMDAAKIMFAQSESGYITQKEGAGSGSDNMMDSVTRSAK